jgi:hypothetical protein
LLLLDTPGCEWDPSKKQVAASVELAKRISKVDGAALMAVAKVANASSNLYSPPGDVLEALSTALKLKVPTKPTLAQFKKPAKAA